MKFTKLATAMALGLALTAAHAVDLQEADGTSSATATFNVKIQLTGVCDVEQFDGITANDIDFGANEAVSNTAALSKDNAGGTQLTVACSNGVETSIALTPASGGTTGAGEMGHTVAADKIAYQLYQPTLSGSNYVAASTTEWGAGTAALEVTGQGVETPLALPVTAVIPVGELANKAVGNYIEEVTATLTY